MKPMSEREAWLYMSKSENWEKREDGFYYFSESFILKGLCSVAACLVEMLTYDKMIKKIERIPDRKHSAFKWSTTNREGNRARRRFCREQAKLCK